MNLGRYFKSNKMNIKSTEIGKDLNYYQNNERTNVPSQKAESWMAREISQLRKCNELGCDHWCAKRIDLY